MCVISVRDLFIVFKYPSKQIIFAPQITSYEVFDGSSLFDTCANFPILLILAPSLCWHENFHVSLLKKKRT